MDLCIQWVAVDFSYHTIILMWILKKYMKLQGSRTCRPPDWIQRSHHLYWYWLLQTNNIIFILLLYSLPLLLLHTTSSLWYTHSRDYSQKQGKTCNPWGLHTPAPTQDRRMIGYIETHIYPTHQPGDIGQLSRSLPMQTVHICLNAVW